MGSIIEPTSIRGDPNRSGILQSAQSRAGEAADASLRRLTRSAASGAAARASRVGKPLEGPRLPDEGWQAALRLLLEKRLRSEIYGLQIVRANYVENQIYRGRCQACRERCHRWRWQGRARWYLARWAHIRHSQGRRFLHRSKFARLRSFERQESRMGFERRRRNCEQCASFFRMRMPPRDRN
jgi:hypothetical protein